MIKSTLFAGLLLLLVGCGDDHHHHSYHQTSIHNIVELNDVCNTLIEDESFRINLVTYITIEEGNCMIEINMPEPKGEENE